MAEKGWGWPLRSRKAHYFNDSSISLCGSWLYSGELREGNDNSPDNCVRCRRKLQKLREKG